MQGRVLPPKTEAFIAFLCGELDGLLAASDKKRPRGAFPWRAITSQA